MEKSAIKFCFIMRGIPGSGKTVVAKKLIESGGIIHSPGVHFLDLKVSAGQNSDRARCTSTPQN